MVLKRIFLPLFICVLLVGCVNSQVVTSSGSTPPGRSVDATNSATIPTAHPEQHVSTQGSEGDVPSAFPLFPGTQWTYIRDDYIEAPGDPSQLLHGKTQIVESVIELREASGYQIVHIQGQKSLLEADPGWAEAQPTDLMEYEYWYIVQTNSVYRSETEPDPAHIQVDLLTEEYTFPMVVGAAWCPQKVSNPDDSLATKSPLPCEYAGKRSVEQVGPYSSKAGSFERCTQLVDFYNSGSFIRWFCDSVGLVALKYDHMGTRFGYTQELVGFKQESDRSTPSPTSSATNLASTPSDAAVPSFSKSYPSGLQVEEYALKHAPQLDPLSFEPVESSQRAVLAVHQRDRSEHTYGERTYGEDALLYPVTGGDSYVARTTYPNEGGTPKATIQVLNKGVSVYSAAAGDVSPLDPAQGLWVFSGHWVLEYVHIANSLATPNVIHSDNVGQVVQDGVSINQRDGLEEAFGFQLIQDQPFYFFKNNGQIGASFAGQNLGLSYDKIPHYGCCSFGELNPIHAKKMIAFFAQRGETWYYVEIGKYN